ncbi:MAG: cysteine desulfurase family protein [Candidatus Dadabacteria bacterium]|nr:cysteine desulfurase family protein [Candidatus Dadabacteria bacterium]
MPFSIRKVKFLAGQVIQNQKFSKKQELIEIGYQVAEKQAVYLDYQASTPLSERAYEAMKHAEEVGFANPHSSEHAFGWRSAEIVETAAREVANFVGAVESEIVFTSGATEANNLAVIGTGLSGYVGGKRKKIIVSQIEHKCILGAARFLEENFSYQIVKAEVGNDGLLNLERLEKAIDGETLLVSVMAVNNEIGSCQPIKEISQLCHNAGAIFHVDAAQAVYREIDVVEDGIDLLSLSSHKMYGPKGIGALFINRFIEVEPTPLFHGGGQQGGYRSGTVPTSLVAGFAEAVKEISENREAEKRYVLSLRDFMWKSLKKELPDCKLNGSLEYRHPGNINVVLPDIDAKLLIGNLQPEIAISTGSACTSGIQEPSHVLRAIGLNSEDSESSIRISVGRYTTQKEIEYAISRIACAARSYKSEFSDSQKAII